MPHPNPLDSFSPGTSLFQRHMNLCMGAGFICLIVNFGVQIPAVILDLAQGGDPPDFSKTVEIIQSGSHDDRAWLFLNYTTLFVHGCASGVLSLGLSRIGLKLLDGEDATLEDMIPRFTQLPGAFVAASTVAMLTMLGILMCCVPGLFVFGLFMYWPSIMVDQQVGSLTALARSGSLALKRPKEHCLAGGLLFALWWAGNLWCGLPVIFLAPMSALVAATAYRNLVPKKPAVDLI